MEVSINRVPQEKRDLAKKFKAYRSVYVNINVTYLPKFEGRSYYLFVTIDRATRVMFYQVYENKKAESTEDFMEKCLDYQLPRRLVHADYGVGGVRTGSCAHPAPFPYGLRNHCSLEAGSPSRSPARA